MAFADSNADNIHLALQMMGWSYSGQHKDSPVRVTAHECSVATQKRRTCHSINSMQPNRKLRLGERTGNDAGQWGVRA